MMMLFGHFRGTLLALTLALTAGGCQTAAPNERPYGPASYGGKIIDAHSHPRKPNRDKLQRHFKEAADAGVERMIVMHTPNDYRKDKKKVKILRRSVTFSNVTVLCTGNFVGFIYKGDLEKARRVVEQIEADLAAGKCTGIGEVGLRHYDKSRSGKQPVVTAPLDHPLVHRVLAAANTHAAPVVLHIETVNAVNGVDKVSEIKRWYKNVCRKYPKAAFVASHTGMMSPANLEGLLRACPNLTADFKVLHNEGAVNGFSHLFGVNGLRFRFFDNWAALFEKYPDRFIFASDWKDQQNGYTDISYGDHIAIVRRMIGSLAPAAQEKIAYSNAKRIFKLP